MPRRLLDAVEAQRIELYASRALIAELEDVLSREKFTAQLRQTRFTAAFLLARYSQLATLIAAAEVTVPELRDPDDAPIRALVLPRETVAPPHVGPTAPGAGTGHATSR